MSKHLAHVIQIRLAELRSANRLGVFWILLEHSSTTTFVGNWRRAVKIVAYRRDLNLCYRRESTVSDRKLLKLRNADGYQERFQ